MIQELWHGDCLELMKNIPDKSVDAIICDLPYGTTACKWDTVIPFEKLWEYLIKTYTNEGDLVFDPTAGSLTTGVAAENLNRRWIVCEQLEEYFKKGVARFSKSEISKELQEML